METKKINLDGKDRILYRYNKNWILPVFDIYEVGIGSPIFLALYSYKKRELEPYTTVTVNLPDCSRGAGCQFIDTNKNGEDILGWLEENGFGILTGNFGQSGFCKYPEFNFYKGERFWEYKKSLEETQEIPIKESDEEQDEG